MGEIMITEGQFYEQVFDQFKEINRKIDDNHNDTNEKIVDLCNKISDVKSEICTHLEVVKAVDSSETNKIEHRDRNFYIAIAIVGVVFSIVTLVKG